MYIVANDNTTFVNADRVDCFYLKPTPNVSRPTISAMARMGTTDVTLGVYNSADFALKALVETIQKILIGPLGNIQSVQFMPRESPEEVDKAKREAVKEEKHE